MLAPILGRPAISRLLRQREIGSLPAAAGQNLRQSSSLISGTLSVRLLQLATQPPALVIETAAALVASIATRSPGRRAAAKSRIAGLTLKLFTTPSAVLTVATPVDAS